MKMRLVFVLVLILALGANTVLAAQTVTIAYDPVTLTGGLQDGNFPDVWNVKQCDLVINATVDLRGLRDNPAHAWGQLGARDTDWTGNYNPGGIAGGHGVWLATNYESGSATFGPDPAGFPVFDLDDKLLLQRARDGDERAYNLPAVPSQPYLNHRFWFDRDGIDESSSNPLNINGASYNTEGVYDVVITLHGENNTTGTAYLTVNDLQQGFEENNDWTTMELSPAGMTFTGDMKRMQVFYGLKGIGSSQHTVTFTNVTVQGCLRGSGGPD